MTDFSVYSELLSNTGRLQLPSESTVKTDLSAFLLNDGKNCLLPLLSVVNEVIWKMSVEVLKTSNFISGHGLTSYFIFQLKRKVGLER